MSRAPRGGDTLHPGGIGPPASGHLPIIGPFRQKGLRISPHQAEGGFGGCDHPEWEKDLG